MIDKQLAKKYADPNCELCGGAGWYFQVGIEPDDGREVYCGCAKRGMDEAHAESQEDK